jgi:hypothetical protein
MCPQLVRGPVDNSDIEKFLPNERVVRLVLVAERLQMIEDVSELHVLLGRCYPQILLWIVEAPHLNVPDFILYIVLKVE